MLLAAPVTIVADSDDLSVYYLAPGTPCMRTAYRPHRPDFLRNLADRNWTLENRPWHTTRRLSLFRPDAGHMITAFSTDDGKFLSWYVDFIEPVRRTPLGFDFQDLVVDIVIGDDLSWQWKDEEEFAAARKIGLISDEVATTVEAEGRAVLEEIEGGDPWWLDWRNWTPDPSWPIPALPDGWDA